MQNEWVFGMKTKEQMMGLKREEIARPDSCLNKARDDEPVFVLRANDPIAPEIVRRWADRYQTRKATLQRTFGNPEDMTRVRAKADEARAVATAMEEWRKLVAQP